MGGVSPGHVKINKPSKTIKILFADNYSDKYEEDEIGFGGHGPDLSDIQCTNCKHRNLFEWKGIKYNAAGANNCAKYKSKPDGVLFTIKQNNQDRIGKYIPCPYYESDNN